MNAYQRPTADPDRLRAAPACPRCNGKMERIRRRFLDRVASLVVLWLMSMAGTLLSVYSVRPDLKLWYRTVELLTTVPVLGVPVPGTQGAGVDSLLSIVQMPAGIPTATFAMGRAGAVNAALFALQILALNDPTLAQFLKDERKRLEGEAIASSATLLEG